MRRQDRHSQQYRIVTSCFLGRHKREQEVVLLVDPEPTAPERCLLTKVSVLIIRMDSMPL